MHRPLAFEVCLFARALMAVPPSARPGLARDILAEADEAHGQVRKTQRHPAFGDGSLMSALARRPILAERFADDPEFLLSLTIAADAIMEHTLRQ